MRKSTIVTPQSKYAGTDADDPIIAALIEMGACPAPGDHDAASRPMDWNAVFLMGTAGSGKSKVKYQKYLNKFNYVNIDPDEYKKKHPEYDPNNPAKLHEWSSDMRDKELERVLTNGKGEPFILDGTGANVQNLASRVEKAIEVGYYTFLLWVYVPLEVSYFRNRNRDRFVSEKVIANQAEGTRNTFETLKRRVYKAHTVFNYEKDDVVDAEEDQKNYPAPQSSRPPRPWMEEYEYASGKVHAWRTPAVASKMTDDLKAFLTVKYGEANLPPEYRQKNLGDEKKQELLKRIRQSRLRKGILV